ncbi:glycosyltransferase [Providencia stuartii]|uniref:glycosyltransferase n=1 Tax=Providencia stuartii TaxID=588 RepID=UPI0024AA251C|nr:glycosyltransferase [Providencia stuartii]MCX3071629.1 glycosyltransferase [Providencia stuartii]
METINKLTCPKSESEIQSHWKYTDKVYISCVCITYNHEIYIKDTIDSILAQKSDYRFELIIHDDKSTDKTRDIILEYKEKFPSIIKLILQEENQYSKCPRIIPLTIPYLSGEYVTICEGDDFWIDELKIQRQVGALNIHKNINICFTPAQSLFSNGSTKLVSYHSDQETIFSTDTVIEGGGGFMPTASIMIRNPILNNLPKWYYTAPVGDYFLQIYASMPSGALYIPNITCVYRINSIGSWSKQRNSLPLADIINEGILYTKSFKQLKHYSIKKEIINSEIAKQYTTLTLLAIKNNYLSSAKQLIKKSWAYSKKTNKKQIILFYLKDFMIIFRWVYILKNKLQYNKHTS